MADHWWLLATAGLFSGLLAGLLGIGGGTVLVPILTALGYVYDQAVATSSLAIVLTSLSGTIQNWRMGYLDWTRVVYLGLPAVLTAQAGAYLVEQLPDYIKEAAFGALLITTIFLVALKKRLINRESEHRQINPALARLGTGGVAGLLAGLFGVGGGVIMVPMQMLLLGEKIKVAIQTSLGVIVITAISATVGHALRDNVLFFVGVILGLGGLVGAQVSTRFLPKLPDRVVSFFFRLLLAVLAVYFFWQAWQSYQA
ncbi:MAG: sulfite exporter TauE/SafE family protein [Cyanophyceae cyanobacterium]